MPTAVQIDAACQKGQSVFLGKGKSRKQIHGASTHYATVAAKPGHVWIFLMKTGIWDEVDSNLITIEEKTMRAGTSKVTGISHKRNGKRDTGKGGTGLPSESAARLAAAKGKDKPKDATTSLKDLKNVLSGAEPSAEPAKGNGKDTAATKKAAAKAKPKVISRTTPKQGELPGVEVSKRKVQEIEDLADVFEDKKLAAKKASDDLKDAKTDLIVSMRKHDRLQYSRQTFGKVKVKPGKDDVSFKRDTTGQKKGDK